LAGINGHLKAVAAPIRSVKTLVLRANSMNTAITEVKYLLEKLPQDSTYEDIQYHLYVVEKIRQGVGRAQREGAVNQDDIGLKLAQWLTQ
jgi:hypothetical protein